MSIQHYIVLLLVAFATTALVTPLAKRIAHRLGIVAIPGARKIHQVPIPQAGGLAMLAGIVVMVLVQAAGEAWLGWRGFLSDFGASPALLASIAAGTLIIFVVGFIDDLYDIRPGTKFAGQIIAAAIVALGGLRIDYVSNPFDSSLLAMGDVLGVALTVIYLVSFANIINLVDGLDGLAAGVAGIAACSLLALAAGSNQLAAAIIAVGIVGATLGFLIYNFPPASIFMGDQGALTLGFLLGVVSLTGVMKTTAAIALAVPLLIVGVPIFDTASAIIRRVRSNRPIKEADKGHIHHRLLGRGFGQRQTVLIIYAWSAMLALGGYAVRYAPAHIRLATVVALLIITALIAYWLGIFESAQHHDEDGR